jgi:hypothetical protein
MNYSPRHITRLVASAICSLERSAEHTPSWKKGKIWYNKGEKIWII